MILPASRKLTSEQEFKIADIYQQDGMSAREIADIFGVSDRTVSRILKCQGISPRRYKFTPEQELKVIKTYLSGKTAEEVGDVFGINKKTVLDCLKRHSVPRRNAWHQKDDKHPRPPYLYRHLLVEKQGNLCAWPRCREPFSKGDNIHVDHAHICCDGSLTCGHCVRGAVHRFCNVKAIVACDQALCLGAIFPPDIQGYLERRGIVAATSLSYFSRRSTV